jgi:hypothetical protein
MRCDKGGIGKPRSPLNSQSGGFPGPKRPVKRPLPGLGGTRWRRRSPPAARRPRRGPSGYYCDGQFDSRSGIALPRPARGIAPCTGAEGSSPSTAAIWTDSSGAVCQGPDASALASAGNKTSAPGGTTVAVKSTLLPPVPTVTFGCAPGGRERTNTTITSKLLWAQRSISPARSISDFTMSAVRIIETVSVPVDGFVVRTSRQVPMPGPGFGPGVGAAGYDGFEVASSKQRNRAAASAMVRQRCKLVCGSGDCPNAGPIVERTVSRPPRQPKRAKTERLGFVVLQSFGIPGSGKPVIQFAHTRSKIDEFGWLNVWKRPDTSA